MNECVISMKADGHKLKATVTNYNIAAGKLSITCNKDDGMNFVLTNEHGRLLEQGFIDEPYNNEDYQINICFRVNDAAYKIYNAKIESIFIQDTCEIEFGFKLYNNINTITDSLKTLGGCMQ